MEIMKSESPAENDSRSRAKPFFASGKLEAVLRLMRPHGWYCMALAALAAVLLWRGLASSSLVLSAQGQDVFRYFYHTYSFIHEGFHNNEFCAWNPYIYGGNVVLESFQYATLYPMRWLCDLLPMPMAMNWMWFLHVSLAGINMYAWVFYRDKSSPGAFVAGAVYMLCGPLFARLWIGHFTPICVVAWIPLVFLGIDGWCRCRRFEWLVLASVASALQIYAGHPQFFYFTAFMAGLYSLWTLATSGKKMRTAAGLLAIYPLAALLAAAQLVPSLLYASQEAVRSGGMATWWSAVASMQYKDLLFIFVPNFFGGFLDQNYWDNEFIWEMWNYSGLGGLVLACVGLCKISKGEKARFVVLMILTLVLALGVFTPLFEVLRAYLPMYSSFRAMGRWALFFSLFVALLAGTGLGKIASGEKIPRGVSWGALGLGVVFLMIGLLLCGSSLNNWYHNLADWLTFKPSYRQNLMFVDRQAVAQNTSAHALLYSGGLAAILGLILLFVKQRKWTVRLLIAVSLTDLILFAAPMVVYFDKSAAAYPEIVAATKNLPPGGRTLNLVDSTSSNITLKQEGIWGVDAVASKRYVQLVAISQGIDPASVFMELPIYRNSSIFKLLRGRYAFVRTGGGIQFAELHSEQDVLPRFLVIGNYEVSADRDQVLQTLAGPFFDFRRRVILETNPGFPPRILAPDNKINVISSSSSRWVVEVETSGPGILLMTDSYAKGWRARALDGSVQASYDLQPADWAVRGIPLLVPGKHIIEIKYTPPGFALGLGVTLATLLALAAFALIALRRRRHPRPFGHPQAIRS